MISDGRSVVPPRSRDDEASPLGDDAFARLMAPLGPFEPAPHVAVAVSGGADSVALTLLADRWARVQGGSITALTVDHRLRPTSSREARALGECLRRRSIAHDILVWHGPYPQHDVQAAARTARYRLLGDWCRGRGVLHLLTAHHRNDQAETFVLRLARGSGVAGLACIAPIVEEPHFRLLRPLLDVPSEQLRATLRSAGEVWNEDPSNADLRFARARVRAQRDNLAAAGLTDFRLAETCRHLGRVRVMLERQTERVLVQAALLHPAGFALVDPGPLRAAPEEIGLRALAALVATIGAAAYTPRFQRLEGLARVLFGDEPLRGRTLGGCRLLPYRGRILVQREATALASSVELSGSGPWIWDDRFLVRHRDGVVPPDLHLGALGDESAAKMRAIVTTDRAHHLPTSVRPTLPAFRQGGRLVAVPHLGWWQPGPVAGFEVGLRSVRPLAGSGFTVV
ncbi:MAG: tRNA(Ile)-lysidine synthase [Aliidongia sp.]|nr:tRNA(Ile)-lysidine synthase [Aliidongia sp.]